MKRLGLIGEHLGHSLSPQMHSLLLKHLGIEGSYELLEVAPNMLQDLVESLPGRYVGVNVTIPYKVAVMKFLAEIAPEALSIGAVNTISCRQGLLCGANTDYFGFGRMLEHNDIVLKGQRVTVLGTGGAARAVLQYVQDAGASELTIISRYPQEAAKSLEQFAQQAQVRFMDYHQLEQQASGDVLVNATPIGMYPKVEAAPVMRASVKNYRAVVDLIYNPAQTLLLRYAQEAGLKTCNGLYMLVAQAVAAEEIWLEQKLDNQIIATVAEELVRTL